MCEKSANKKKCEDCVCCNLKGPLEIFVEGQTLLFDNICFDNFKDILTVKQFGLVGILLKLIQQMETSSLNESGVNFDTKELQRLIDMF